MIPENLFKYIVIAVLMTFSAFICYLYYKDYFDVRKEIIFKKNKVIILPDHLFSLDNRKVSDSIIKNSPFKICVYINGDCGNCTKTLFEWKDFITKNSNKLLNCKILFFITTSNRYLIENYLVQIDFYENVFLDFDNTYNISNKFSDPLFSTVLINKKNEIVLVGNPLGNKKLTKMYIKKIENKSYRTSRGIFYEYKFFLQTENILYN